MGTYLVELELPAKNFDHALAQAKKLLPAGVVMRVKIEHQPEHQEQDQELLDLDDPPNFPSSFHLPMPAGDERGGWRAKTPTASMKPAPCLCPPKSLPDEVPQASGSA